MKPLILFLLVLYALPAIGQQDALPRYLTRTSVLVVNLYHNNQYQKRRIKSKHITLKSGSHDLAIRDSAGLLVLPRIKKTDTLDLTVRVGRRSMGMRAIPGWRLQPGATVSIGRLDNWRRVISIVAEDKLSQMDEDYELFRTRYRVAPEGSTLDIPAITRFKSVDYIEVVGYGQGSVITTWKGYLK